MQLGRVSEDLWTLKLAPQMIGKGQQAYAAMNTTDAADYRKVKEAILRRYDINEETYRQRFRSGQKKAGEAYGELAVRLHDLASKWLAGCGTVEEVLERLVVEQLANTMPTEIRVWVAERKPRTGAEAGRLVDDYLQARRHVRQGIQGTAKERSTGGAGEPRKCHRCGSEDHLKRDCPVKEGSGGAGNPPRSATGKSGNLVKCYNCKRFGHMNCPEKASYFVKDGWGRSVARAGRVEGAAVSDILLDTGCTRTMVRSDLVAEENLLPGEAVTVLCAHGDTVLYPLARDTINVEGLRWR